MSWVKTDDGAPEHLKQREAGTAAYALWNAALGYCNRNLTDGRIEMAMVKDVWRPIGERFNHKRAASKLVEIALWHTPRSTCRSQLCPANSARSVQLDSVQHAYLVHDYFEYQKSKIEILAEREKNNNRQQQHRLRKLNGSAEFSGHDVSNGVTYDVTDGVTNTVSHRGPVPAPVPGPVPVGREGLGPTLENFVQAVSDAGIAIQLGREDRERFSKLYPVEHWELDHAIGEAQKAKAKKASYVLTVIENGRERAADVRTGPTPPPATKPRGPRNVTADLDRVAEEFAQEIMHGSK